MPLGTRATRSVPSGWACAFAHPSRIRLLIRIWSTPRALMFFTCFRCSCWMGAAATPIICSRTMMQDYCKTFDNRSASNEDFKAIVEKHMIPSMDLDENQRLGWFFNQYVYGTGEPQYSFHAALDYTPDGKTHMKAELTRAERPDTWKDSVPIYAHVGDRTVKVGNIRSAHRTETIDTSIAGNNDRVSNNDYEDMLADEKQ